MTYRHALPDCGENCRDLLCDTIAVELQAFKSTLYRLWRRLHVALRDHNAAVPGDAHHGESVHSRFSESSKHCMA
jgi:hypothetical protein